MHEEFLHYIWKHKLYSYKNLKTECNQELEVIHPGDYNSNAGPDFFNAKIKLGTTVWAGNVELHTKASDWSLHQHQTDKAYNNVILHVVDEVDDEVRNEQGIVIPAFQLKYSSAILSEYHSLKLTENFIPCSDKICKVNSFEISMWMQRMLIERLEDKMKSIQKILSQSINNWDEVFYRVLFRSFGQGVNGDPFEMLANSISLSVLLKYCGDLSLVEALLFGQAGFLEGKFGDEYALKLQKDYRYIKQKHQLTPIKNHLWRFLRLRPANFPTIRISQLANLLVKFKGVFGELINASSTSDLENSLTANTSAYWQSHYVFEKESKRRAKKLSKSSIQIIILNTIIPYLFTYGRIRNEEAFENKALKWLSELKVEENTIVRQWKMNEIAVKSAGDSQALIYLFNNYCKHKRCLYCRIGHQVLALKK